MNRFENRIGLVARGFSSSLLGLAALAMGAGLLSPAWAGDAGTPIGRLAFRGSG